MKVWINTCICVIVTFCVACRCDCKIPAAVEDLLPASYNNQEPDKKDNLPVEVGVKISLLSFKDVREAETSISIEIFLHLKWQDGRLKWPEGRNDSDYLKLDSSAMKGLWVPDIYFKNAQTGHVMDIMYKSIYVKIDNRTNIFMASRISLDLKCNMDFRKYPFDTQNCNIDVMSMANTMDAVKLKWIDFKVTGNLFLADYEITEVVVKQIIKNYGIGKFTMLRGSLTMKRNVGKFIVKRFLPTFFVVLLTFVGFWLPTSDISARVSLVITAILAVIADQIQAQDLNVSYVYALGVWSLGCTTFVFFSLIEFAFALSWEAYDKGKGLGQGVSDESPTLSPKHLLDHSHGNHVLVNEVEVKCKQQVKRRDKKCLSVVCCLSKGNNPIDVYARILFPGAYLTFICVYGYCYAL